MTSLEQLEKQLQKLKKQLDKLDLERLEAEGPVQRDTSDADFYSTKDALRDRYLRKMELLRAVSADSFSPYRVTMAYLSDKTEALNKGNSRRTMTDYLKDHALLGYGKFKGDYFEVTDLGRQRIRAFEAEMRGYLTPLAKIKEELERFRRDLEEKRAQ